MSTLKQQCKNRLHLADILENRIEDKNFDMSSYTNECGTIGCALGIAVLSGEFGYRATLPTDDTGIWDPVKRGKITTWPEAGIDLFGETAFYKVFLRDNPRPRQKVAAELRAIK
jgi:hypothetical protein